MTALFIGEDRRVPDGSVHVLSLDLYMGWTCLDRIGPKITFYGLG